MNYSSYLLRHLRSTIGKNIHNQRAKRKMTLLKLSKLSGVPEYLLDHYELGKNEIKLDELLKVSCVLNIEMKSLFE